MRRFSLKRLDNWTLKAECCTSSGSRTDYPPRTPSEVARYGRSRHGWSRGRRCSQRAKMQPEGDAFFLSERRRPLSRKTVWLMIRDYGRRAGLPIDAHPHILRHACGVALADQGADTRLIQDYLGHRNIQHTVRYTATNPARFERLWRQPDRPAVISPRGGRKKGCFFKRTRHPQFFSPIL